MIRINLGKDDFEKVSKSPSFLDPKMAEKLGLQNVHFDLSTVIQIVVVTAFSCLPYLFSTQYRAYVQAQMDVQIKTLTEKTEELKGQIVQMKVYKDELESYEEQKRKIRERLNVVKQLLETRATPVNVLDAVGQSLPKRGWLESVEFDTADKGRLQLTGMALSNDDVSDFVDKLSESIHLGEVTLENMAAKSQDGADGRGFQITAVPKGAGMLATSTPPSSGAPTAKRDTATASPGVQR